MGHHSCCNQQKVKRGLWSPEEDEKLIRYITTHGYGCWSEVPEKAASLNNETWNSNQHQIQSLPPSTSFTTGIDAHYLPPLIENMENMVPIDHHNQVQSCSMDDEGEIALECLQRQELNEWVESQHSNFLFWDNVDGPLGGEDIAPASSNTGTTLSSFP
ncbi:hypothetical protein Patl1_17645 [Pistacia atlantica]|uniref:Uncharacterized protein n=1 Tax=Pistacia atlantica TaxID=434234 RepID=A0ACC1BXP7_9ROSI|nr:hypothetical protein Patl1_17645 [Pistacia atlantica]